MSVHKLQAQVIKTLNPRSLRQLLLHSPSPQTLCYAQFVLDDIPATTLDTFSWNTAIKSSSPTHSLALFASMIRGCAARPDGYTFPLVLKACAAARVVRLGREVHGMAAKVGFLGSDVYVNNALVSFYGRSGLVEDAVKMFDEMRVRDVVSWSSMIGCFVENGFGYDAVSLFRQMQVDGVDGVWKPDEVMMLSVISGIASLGDLELGKWVRKYVVRIGLSSPLSVELGTALINMYSRCGDVDESVKVFDEMGERNLWTWTALINGLAIHGRGGEAVEVFDRMVGSGLQPDDIAYTGVLVACSHSGLVDEGWRIFNSIWNVEEPLMEHYGCMVDLLGRAGLVKEAYDFVQKMPMKPNPVIWRTLLGACVNHNHIELAETVEERIQKVEPNHDGDYVLLSNAYCTAGRWAEKAGLMHAMEQKGISKQLGCSWINMDQERHEFVSGDTKHPQADQIREFLVTSVMKALRDQGYTPSVSSSMFDLEVEEKEESVVHHSEKLAVAFALLGSKDHGAIRIMKNLRICGDCHSFMKHVSKTFDKEVVVRDRNRFHHFKQGCCSCGDYW